MLVSDVTNTFQAPPHTGQVHGGSLASSRKLQKLELLVEVPLAQFFFGASRF